jgi:predicted ribosome quality control (RQC) complex YloA/Tae2 family protein
MSMTHGELSSIVDEVNETAVPSGVQKVFEASPRAVVLQLRGGGETHYLRVDTTPGWSRMHFVDRKPRQPPHPSGFTMQLRKELVGCGLVGLTLDDADRIVRLRFERSEPHRERTLLAELTGRHGNLFLLDEEGAVIGLQHGSHGVRNLHPGRPWSAPPPAPSLDESVRPALRERERGTAVLADFFEREIADEQRRRLRKRVRSQLKSAHKRLRRLKKNVEGDLDRAEEATDYRRWGELLQSAYGKEIPRGAETVDVPDYYAEGAPTVSIPLDPSKTLQENIDRYFHEYRRLHDAAERIEDRLLETMEELETVSAFREELADGIDDEELEEFVERVRAAGFIRQKQRQRKTKKKERLPYRRFSSRKGTPILVGRGSKSNDELTTRVARGRDVWLHARDWPGAHVVLRMEKESAPDSDDLLDAALLAAHFSKGKGDSLTDVTYTRAKHVRKPKGAAPGLVTVAGGSTIAVSPEPELLAELLESEE